MTNFETNRRIPIDIVMSWMVEHRGIATGIVTGAFGASGLIFCVLQTKLINPNNLSCSGEDGCPLEVVDNLPSLLTTLSGIYAIVQCIGLLCLTENHSHDYSPRTADNNNTTTPEARGNAGATTLVLSFLF